MLRVTVVFESCTVFSSHDRASMSEVDMFSSVSHLLQFVEPRGAHKASVPHPREKIDGNVQANFDGAGIALPRRPPRTATFCRCSWAVGSNYWWWLQMLLLSQRPSLPVPRSQASCRGSTFRSRPRLGKPVGSTRWEYLFRQ